MIYRILILEFRKEFGIRKAEYLNRDIVRLTYQNKLIRANKNFSCSQINLEPSVELRNSKKLRHIRILVN